MNTRWPQRGLYAITADEADVERLLGQVEGVLQAGAAWLQYRNKNADSATGERQARALLPLCRRYAVPLIINDDWQLAAAIGADGVHLGEHDGAVAVARIALGSDRLVGASCYGSGELARRAVAAGADYVAFGAFFASTTKPDAPRAELRVLREAAPLGVPRVAIGGITPDNARLLVDAGADLIAVITGLFASADPGNAARAYLSCIEAPDYLDQPDHE